MIILSRVGIVTQYSIKSRGEDNDHEYAHVTAGESSVDKTEVSQEEAKEGIVSEGKQNLRQRKKPSAINSSINEEVDEDEIIDTQIGQ